jgi:hypothetical protein
VAAIGRLIDRRCADPLAGIPVVSSVVLVDLPDAHHTRPPGLATRYGGSGATHRRAMDRLAAAGLRRGYRLTH